MTRLLLLSTVGIALGASAALAGQTADIRPASAPLNVPQKKIQDVPLHPVFAANGAFGSAVEEALMRQAPTNLVDPSGKFAINVSTDGAGRVIRVAPRGMGEAREWRLAPGSGDLVVEATITEVMAAVGQVPMPGLAGVGRVTAQKTK